MRTRMLADSLSSALGASLLLSLWHQGKAPEIQEAQCSSNPLVGASLWTVLQSGSPRLAHREQKEESGHIVVAVAGLA